MSRVISLINEDGESVEQHPAWMVGLLSGWEHRWAQSFVSNQSEIKYVLAWYLEKLRLESLAETGYADLDAEFNVKAKPRNQKLIALMSHQDPSLVFQDRFGQWNIKYNPDASLLTETIVQRIESGRSLYQSQDVPQEITRWVNFLEVSGYLDQTINFKSLPYRH